MKKFINILFVAIYLLIGIKSNAQVVIQSQCPNTDFSSLDFTNWTGCYCLSGSTCYTAIATGVLSNCIYNSPPTPINCGNIGFHTTSTLAQPSLHTILTNANTSYYNGSSPSLTGLYDSLTAYGLRKIPAGVGQVCRLNSWKTGYQSSQLSYTMTVDTNVSGLFVYSYAAVLEFPTGHDCHDQPYFQIRINDANGNAINNTCGSFTYIAGTNPPGNIIHTANVPGHSSVKWFDWQTVGLSLKPYHGQTIKLQFIAADCGQSGHFGYAYFYGYCLPRHIDINYCPGSTTAVLSAPAGFRYKWLPSNDTTQSISVVGPVDSTIYQVVISSLNNSVCTDTLSALLVPNIIHSDFTFNNECVGVPVNFNRTTTSNTPIYNWIWNFGDPGSLGNQLNFIASPTHTYNTPGTYSVMLIDSLLSGCPDTVSIDVTVYPNPTIVTVGDSVCFGDSALISVSGANTYLWSNGNTNASQYVHPVIAPNLVTFDTTFQVIATSSLGCVDSSFAIVSIDPLPRINFETDITTGCEPIQTHFLNQTEPLNSTYVWDFGDNSTSTTTSPTHTYHAGEFSVTITAISSNGCKDVAVVPNLIKVYPQPIADFTWTPPIGTILNPLLQFTNITTPFDSSFLWSWLFAGPLPGNTILGTSNAISPSFLFPNSSLDEKEYMVTLIATNANDCNDTVSYTLKIINEVLIFPNIMTPNGDGVNDKFDIGALIKGGGYTETQVIIFNRWGKKVYESNNYKNDFDGEGLPDGVYFVTIKAKGLIKDVEYKSSLQILR